MQPSTSEQITKKSASNLALAFALLPKEKRDAMSALYAFCREVDDIADEGGTREQKLAALNGWRAEIDRLFDGRPQYPTGVALLGPMREFDLPREEFILMIEGMEKMLLDRGFKHHSRKEAGNIFVERFWAD